MSLRSLSASPLIVLLGVVLAGCSPQSATLVPSASVVSTVPRPTVTVTQTSTATPSVPSAQTAYARVAPSVVRFDLSGCDGFSSGTGFIVGKDLIVTAAHVVVGGVDGRVTRGTTSSSYVVVAVNEKSDLALVWSSTPLGGRSVELSTDALAVGQPVATVGYSLGGNVSFHEGIVNGLDRKENIEGRTATGLIEHSAEALPGDSGAPLIDISGRVVGVQDAGITDVAGQRLAVPSLALERLIQNWGGTHVSAVSTPSCDAVYGPDGELRTADEFTSVQLGAWDTLLTRVDALNRGDWAAAAAQFTPTRDPKAIKAGSEDSQLSDLDPQDMWLEKGRPVIWATMTTRQSAGKGPSARPDETCTDWSVEYLFAKKNGLWLLTGSRTHDGEEASRPCS